MIIEKTGDIMDADELIIGHQASCLGVAVSNLGFQIKLTYPNVFNSYEAAAQAYGSRNLGNCLCLVSDDQEHVIACLFAQDDIGKDSHQTNYDALERALRQLHDIAKFNGDKVALPHGLGCGEAGGDWKVVRQMIDHIFNDYEVSIYKLEED